MTFTNRLTWVRCKTYDFLPKPRGPVDQLDLHVFRPQPDNSLCCKACATALRGLALLPSFSWQSSLDSWTAGNIPTRSQLHNTHPSTNGAITLIKTNVLLLRQADSPCDNQLTCKLWENCGELAAVRVVLRRTGDNGLTPLYGQTYRQAVPGDLLH